MAALADFDSRSFQNWIIQQDIPATDTSSGGYPDCVVKLQDGCQLIQCNIQVADQTLHHDAKHPLRFKIGASSQCPYFQLELQLTPPPGEGATTTQRQLDYSTRISAIFLAHTDRSHGRDGDRVPHNYKGRLDLSKESPPTGPYNFSGQLRRVEFNFANHDEAPRQIQHGGYGAKDQLWFQWYSAEGCVKTNFGVRRDSLTAEQLKVAKQFTEMMEVASNDKRTIHVITRPRAQIAASFWPLFASIPAPVPESWCLWLYPPNAKDPDLVMRFVPNRTFERSTKAIDRTVAHRPNNWFKSGDENFQNASSVPSDLGLANLPKVTVFFDNRHYLSHVLGGMAYEEEHSKSIANHWYNGMHKTDVFVQSVGTSDGKPHYMFLLNLRPPQSATVEQGDEAAGLPGVNERVSINYKIRGQQVGLTGRTVRIPQDLLKFGRNVAVIAVEDPTVPQQGKILKRVERFNASFHFGHDGSPTGPIIGRIINLVFQKVQQGKFIDGQWLRLLLLGQNNQYHNSNPITPTEIPSDWKDTVAKVCARRNLNPQQRDAIYYYFTHKITVVRGPPGTGKSTLIDAIAELEESFKSPPWICTESNTACDVLVRKVVIRKGNSNPAHIYRVKTTFEEKLDISGSRDSPKFVEKLALPARSGWETLEQQIMRALAGEEAVSRAMTLEVSIKERFAERTSIINHPKNARWENEHQDLMAVIDAGIDFWTLKFEWKTETEFVELQQQLERSFNNKLRHLQAQYIKAAHGIYSTAAAANGPLLRKWAPHAVIMDEASQFMEARAVSALVHAVSGKKLRRIMLIGDDKQLPPTLLAKRNPFSKTGEVSLFERLIATGIDVHMLTEQYRMHPSISQICKDAIYADLGGITDGPQTPAQGKAFMFQQFIQEFAARFGNSSFPKQMNAAVVSPVDSSDYSLKLSRVTGSTSAYNLNTARIVIRLVYELLLYNYKGESFKPSDIMVLSFYKDQVQLLQSIIDPSPNMKGIVVQTVDSSQGSERPIVIVECTTMGAAANDTMGFLNRDDRRFNVAMSRPQIGRITVAHRDMIAKVGKSDKEVRAGPWNAFWKEVRDNNTIISSAKLNSIENVDLLRRFDTGVSAWTAHSKSAKVAGHSNHDKAPGAPEDTQTQSKDPQYDITVFMEVCQGSFEAEAKGYLHNNYDDLAMAINDWLSKHEDDEEPVIELPR